MTVLSSKRTFTGPYEDIHIYQFNGRVYERDEQQIFDEHFIGNWVEDNYSFLFFSAVSDKTISSLLKIRPDLELIDDYMFTYEQWQGEMPTTTKVGNFIIVPPWEEKEPGPGEIKIIMHPGVVFGTGLHPTTADCLKAISFLNEYISFGNILDIGTGTGILAIAAALLGGERVLAVDMNPLSVKTAKTDVMLNGLESSVEVVKGHAEDVLYEGGDIVVANIHYEVIRRLMETEWFFESDYFVFSGLMRSQARDMKDTAASHHLTILREWDYEMTWYTFVVGKQDRA
jgi:ribosomal protein L11 methyltransferase